MFAAEGLSPLLAVGLLGTGIVLLGLVGWLDHRTEGRPRAGASWPAADEERRLMRGAKAPRVLGIDHTGPLFRLRTSGRSVAIDDDQQAERDQRDERDQRAARAVLAREPERVPRRDGVPARPSRTAGSGVTVLGGTPPERPQTPRRPRPPMPDELAAIAQVTEAPAAEVPAAEAPAAEVPAAEVPAAEVPAAEAPAAEVPTPYVAAPDEVAIQAHDHAVAVVQAELARTPRWAPAPAPDPEPEADTPVRPVLRVDDLPDDGEPPHRAPRSRMPKGADAALASLLGDVLPNDSSAQHVA